MQRLEIVTVRIVVRFSQPRIRSNNALNVTALHPSLVASTRIAHLRDTPLPVLLRAFGHARRKQCVHLHVAWLFAFPALRATGRFGLRDDRHRLWERSRRSGFKRRRWYRRQV